MVSFGHHLAPPLLMVPSPSNQRVHRLCRAVSSWHIMAIEEGMSWELNRGQER